MDYTFRMKTQTLDLGKLAPQVYPPLKEGEVPVGIDEWVGILRFFFSHSGRIEGYV
tara:strand:- start:727 stop:894 length:168 start_codon:yes stop_codon:yes gene_type:complete